MSQSGVTARLKSYTHMSSNFDQLFPQSGIRVLFLKQFPRRTRGETGVSIVARVETRLKQILREMDRSVMGRGSEVFRINPEELFQIIEDIGNADASYDAVLPLFPIFRQFFHFHENPSSSVISGTFSRENRFPQKRQKRPKIAKHTKHEPLPKRDAIFATFP